MSNKYDLSDPQVIKDFIALEMVIHCDTLDKASDLLLFLHTLGLTWVTGRSLDDGDTNWTFSKEKSCYGIAKNGVFYREKDISYNIVVPFDEVIIDNTAKYQGSEHDIVMEEFKGALEYLKKNNRLK